MTREEIDVLWQQAMQTAVRANHIYTRYEFANLILEKAAEKLLTIGFKSTGVSAYEYQAEAIRSMKV